MGIPLEVQYGIPLGLALKVLPEVSSGVLSSNCSWVSLGISPDFLQNFLRSSYMHFLCYVTLKNNPASFLQILPKGALGVLRHILYELYELSKKSFKTNVLGSACIFFRKFSQEFFRQFHQKLIREYLYDFVLRNLLHEFQFLAEQPEEFLKESM